MKKILQTSNKNLFIYLVLLLIFTITLINIFSVTAGKVDAWSGTCKEGTDTGSTCIDTTGVARCKSDYTQDCPDGGKQEIKCGTIGNFIAGECINPTTKQETTSCPGGTVWDGSKCAGTIYNNDGDKYEDATPSKGASKTEAKIKEGTTKAVAQETKKSGSSGSGNTDKTKDTDTTDVPVTTSSGNVIIDALSSLTTLLPDSIGKDWLTNQLLPQGTTKEQYETACSTALAKYLADPLCSGKEIKITGAVANSDKTARCNLENKVNSKNNNFTVSLSNTTGGADYNIKYLCEESISDTEEKPSDTPVPTTTNVPVTPTATTAETNEEVTADTTEKVCTQEKYKELIKEGQHTSCYPFTSNPNDYYFTETCSKVEDSTNKVYCCKNSEWIVLTQPRSDGSTEYFCGPSTSSEKINLVSKVKAQPVPQTIDPNNLVSGQYKIQIPGYNATTINIYDNKVQVKYFTDTNGDGIKQDDEQYLDITGLTVSVSKEKEIANYDLTSGWNLIGLNMSSDNFKNAADLVYALASQNVLPLQISSYQSGYWINYVVRVADDGSVVTYGPNFALVPGESYFIKVANSGSVTLAGNTFTESVPVSLENGWNLRSVQSTNTYTATNFLKKCNENSGLNCTSISRFQNELYDSVVKSEDIYFGNDFTLKNTDGYFILNDGNEGSFTP